MKGSDHQNHESTHTYPMTHVHSGGDFGAVESFDVESPAFLGFRAAKPDPGRLNSLETTVSRVTARPWRMKNQNAPVPGLPSIM